MFFYYTERNLIFILKEIQLKVLKYDGTHLTGRHLSMELFPFSYSEFISEYITPNVPLVSLTNVPDISLLNVPLFTGCN